MEKCMRKDILEKRELIERLISENEPNTEIARQLNCKVDTLKSYYKKMGIVYDGNMNRTGKGHKEAYVPASEYFDNTKRISSHKLKLKLINEGIKEHKCEICKLTEWQGKLIPIELDHIDGNHYNNNLENLRILCPNCHAQTETNSGKNRGKFKNK